MSDVLDEFTATEADFDAIAVRARPRRARRPWSIMPGRAPVGIALYYRTVNTFKGQIGMFLEDLFVEPDMRGKGIGIALLRHLAQIAIDRNYNVIEWSVLNWNEPSIRFYERLGAAKVDALAGQAPGRLRADRAGRRRGETWLTRASISSSWAAAPAAMSPRSAPRNWA